MYIEELRSSVNLLMANLESLPVAKGGPDFKQKLKRSTMNNSFLDMGEETEFLSKSDVVLSFTLEVCFCKIILYSCPESYLVVRSGYSQSIDLLISGGLLKERSMCI